jgi:cell wall assembly regulator SMI1
MRPGLSDADMDERVATIGLTLPDEARVFWRWHDGVPEDGRANPIGAFRGRFLPLHEAMAVHRVFRKTVLECHEGEGDPGIRFRPSWLPLFGRQHPIVLDCSVGRDQPTPLRMINLEDPLEPRVRAGSLGEAVRLWTEALDRGWWRWNASGQKWDVDLSSLPPVQRANPLL